MFKELIAALICVVALNSATRVPHGEPIKKQVSYSGYDVPASYQDPSQYRNVAYRQQNQLGVVGQGQIPQTVSSSAGTTGVSLKQSIVPQKSAVYPLSNSVPTQFGYPFKQYYPQIYPQNSQYPSVPSVFYVPSQGRFPAGANEGVSNEGSGGSGTTSQGGYPSWFGNGGSGGGSNWNFPNYWPQTSPQTPTIPQGPNIPYQPQGGGGSSGGSSGGSIYPFPSYPASFPQFPSQFPSQFPAFPSNFPAFPGNAPANSVPTGASPTTVPGSEAIAGTSTNSEGHSSVVVVSARRPEKIENSDLNVEGLKNNEIDNKIATDFPPQQYYVIGQPQYLVPNAGHVPLAQGAGVKDPVHLDGAAKGAVSSFLLQQQQPILAQTPSVQPVSQITQNKLYTPQEFQELVQQVQVANKKLIESNGGNLVPQFYVQQGVPQVPQQGAAQQTVNPQVVSQSQSQDVPSQHVQGVIPQQVQGVIPQQYIFQGAQPVAQVQQPYFQFPVQQQQFFVPPYASLSQQKPVIGEVSNMPGAALAYQRFLLENQKPIKSSFVGVQSGEVTAPLPGVGATQVSVPSSVSSSIPANDSTSSPEPNNNVENDLAGTSAGSKN